MAHIQVGKFLYNTIDVPFAGKVLNVLMKHGKGMSVATVAQDDGILAFVGGDYERAQVKVRTALSTLRFRSVVAEKATNGNSFALFSIVNRDDAAKLVAEGERMADRITQRCVATESVSVSTVSKENKPMATKSKSVKSPRLFLNPESNKVEPFGAGRPSKVKLACECGSDGKYLRPQDAAALLQNGGKADDKLTKSELLDLIRTLRAERDAAIAAVEALTADAADSVEDSVVAVESDEDDLDVEAEADDSDEDSEVDADAAV